MLGTQETRVGSTHAQLAPRGPPTLSPPAAPRGSSGGLALQPARSRRPPARPMRSANAAPVGSPLNCTAAAAASEKAQEPRPPALRPSRLPAHPPRSRRHHTPGAPEPLRPGRRAASAFSRSGENEGADHRASREHSSFTTVSANKTRPPPPRRAGTRRVRGAPRPQMIGVLSAAAATWTGGTRDTEVKRGAQLSACPPREPAGVPAEELGGSLPAPHPFPFLFTNLRALAFPPSLPIHPSIERPIF